MSQSIDDLFEEMQIELSDHFEDILGDDDPLEGHTAERHAEVFEALATYRDALQEKGVAGNDTRIVDTIRVLFEELNEINARADGSLLETDERDIVVPFAIEAAALAGLDADRFEDGDPTFEYRDF